MPGVVPTFDPMTVEEASYLLTGLYALNLAQLKAGAPGVIGALVPGSAGPGRRRLRYIRTDTRERWRPVRRIWQAGGGDCEDLAAASAAELTLNGIPSRPVVYRVRPGLAHVVVERIEDGAIFDPSKLGGMGETPLGGLPYRPDLAHLGALAADVVGCARGAFGWAEALGCADCGGTCGEALGARGGGLCRCTARPDRAVWADVLRRLERQHG